MLNAFVFGQCEQILLPKAIFTARKRSLRRLCYHRCLSTGGGQVYVQRVGGFCWGVSVQGVSVHGVSVWGSLSRGSLSGGSLSRGGFLSGRPPSTVMCGWYTSYWNAFLLPATMKFGQGNIFTSVCLSTGRGGVSASVHAGIYPLGADPPGADTPLPPGSRLQHTVNERPVRILLECILVS